MYMHTYICIYKEKDTPQILVIWRQFKSFKIQLFTILIPPTEKREL